MEIELMSFTITGNEISEIVGSKDYYQNDIKKFLKDANSNYCDRENDYTKEEVKSGYVKYYEGKEMEDAGVNPLLFDDGCYSFCKKGDEGSEEVFYIEVDNDG